MFLIRYHDRVYLDGWRCRDISKAFKAHRVMFHGGIAYCFRSEYAYVSITEDDIDSIDDIDVGVSFDVPESFKAQALVRVG